MLTKQQVMAQIKSIADMGSAELYEYKQKVGMSNIDDKAKFFIYQAIEARELELEGMYSVEVEFGDVKAEEF